MRIWRKETKHKIMAHYEVDDSPRLLVILGDEMSEQCSTFRSAEDVHKKASLA
jgi:hypothetical protein